jgi:hypothetical protein
MGVTTLAIGASLGAFGFGGGSVPTAVDAATQPAAGPAGFAASDDEEEAEWDDDEGEGEEHEREGGEDDDDHEGDFEEDEGEDD